MIERSAESVVQLVVRCKKSLGVLRHHLVHKDGAEALEERELVWKIEGRNQIKTYTRTKKAQQNDLDGGSNQSNYGGRALCVSMLNSRNNLRMVELIVPSCNGSGETHREPNGSTVQRCLWQPHW